MLTVMGKNNRLHLSLSSCSKGTISIEQNEQQHQQTRKQRGSNICSPRLFTACWIDRKVMKAALNIFYCILDLFPAFFFFLNDSRPQQFSYSFNKFSCSIIYF